MQEWFNIQKSINVLQHINSIKKKKNMIVNWQLSKLNIYSCQNSQQTTNWRQCLLSPLLFNIILDILASVIQQEEEIKGKQIGNEESKLSLFADRIIVYIENLKESTKQKKKPSELVSKVSKDLGPTHKNQSYFYTLTMHNWK